MDKERIDIICKSRLGCWKKILVENMSTPILIMGVGHGDKNGEVHLITCENFCNEDFKRIIEIAIKKLE